jgi:hypothetical protein
MHNNIPARLRGDSPHSNNMHDGGARCFVLHDFVQEKHREKYWSDSEPSPQIVLVNITDSR